jgi:hypothetical protein
MVVIGDDGEPLDDWRAELGHRISEYLTPILAEQLSPVAVSMSEQISEMVAPLLDSVATRIHQDLFTPELLALLEQMRRELPDNWPEYVDLDDITDVIQDDGIPLVWVPPAHVVDEVLDALDRTSRVEVLLSHIDELIPDCRRVLADVHTDRLQRQLPLAPRALDALEQGHHEAAQALAVVVIDATIHGWIKGNFKVLKKKVHFDPEEVPYDLVRLQAAIAPLRNFKQDYYLDETTRPSGLNRHVTVHYAESEHFTRGNALVACLLMTSILRALQDSEDTFNAEPES